MVGVLKARDCVVDTGTEGRVIKLDHKGVGWDGLDSTSNNMMAASDVGAYHHHLT